MKIVILGGVYSAELSFLRSFNDNGYKAVGIIDGSTNTGKVNLKWIGNFFPENVTTIKNLPNFLDVFAPDIVIHRWHRSDLCQFYNAYEEAKKRNIFYIGYESETNFDDTKVLTNLNYDILLYGHTTEVMKNKLKNMRFCHYFPYGVSSLEKIIESDKKGIACIGRSWNVNNSNLFWVKEREKSLNWWLDILKELDQKLVVFGDGWPNHPVIENRSSYLFKDFATIINQFKIIINIESIENLDGALSHKLFQSAGCGVPTMTKTKEIYKNLFDDNIIMVNEKQEAIKKIEVLLNSKEEWNKESKKQYDFIHSNFNWYTRFINIFNQYKKV